MYSLRKSKRGFTLIELMVVVAIIGVLALLGLRLYATQQDKAKEALVKANAGSVQVQIQTELVDNSAYSAADAVSDANTEAKMNLRNPFTSGKTDVADDALTTLPTDDTTGTKGAVGVYQDASSKVFTIVGFGKDGTAIDGYILKARR